MTLANPYTQVGHRRIQLRQLVKRQPTPTQSELAAILGVSRQRVAQLLASEGLDVPRGNPGRQKAKR